MSSIKMSILASAVLATGISSPVLADGDDVVLTTEQQVTIDLVREYNTCVLNEDTPERRAEVEAYQTAVTQANQQYELDVKLWRENYKSYMEEFRRVAAENGIEMRFGVPADDPELSREIGVIDIELNERLVISLLEEIGVSEPEYPQSTRERVKALGAKKENAKEYCAGMLTPKFEDAGIDLTWDLSRVVYDVVDQHGVDVYQRLVAPVTP